MNNVTQKAWKNDKSAVLEFLKKETASLFTLVERVLKDPKHAQEKVAYFVECVFHIRHYASKIPAISTAKQAENLLCKIRNTRINLQGFIFEK